MNPTVQNAGYVRSLQILFFALWVGQLMMFGVLWYFVKPPAEPGVYQSPLDIALLGVLVVKRGLAFFLPKKWTEDARSKSNFYEKTDLYRRAQVLRFALWEGSVLIGLIGYFFLTANTLLLLLSALGILSFLAGIPGRNRIVRELDLNMQEEAMLDEHPGTVA